MMLARSIKWTYLVVADVLLHNFYDLVLKGISCCQNQSDEPNDQVFLFIYCKASKMHCWMITTQSKINQSTWLILTHFIHHGVADAFLHDLHTISNQSTILTHFITASQMLCCMVSTQSDISINPASLILTHFIHHGVADALLHDLHKIRNQSIQSS